MGVLWFARQGIDSTSGFPAYELPIHTIAARLGAKCNFQFLSPLYKPPITSLGRSERAVDYRLVLIELDEAEAKAAADEETRRRAEAERIRIAEGRKKNGKTPAPPRKEPDAKAQRNFPDPDSPVSQTTQPAWPFCDAR